MTEVTVRELYSYPVKGCGGGALSELVLTESGIEQDREFAFIDDDGRLVCQKKTPVLASIRVVWAADVLRFSHATQGVLEHHPRLEGESIPGSWVLDKFAGVDQGDEVAQWASEIVGKRVRLIRVGQPWVINFPVHSLKAVHGKSKQRFTAATDVSLTNIASLRALNDALDVPISMDRFRTNIVIDGIGAYEEDQMERVGNDEVEIMQVTPAERCEIITTDQQTGERPRNNILQVLGKTRYKTEHRYGTGLLFGNYMQIARPGVLRVGDRLEVRMNNLQSAL